LLRRLILCCLPIILSACGPLDSIPYTPPQTPQTWLTIQPSIRLGSLLIVQPSTSAIVTLLGLLALGAGGYFLRIRERQVSRVWWGIALLLWGAGALFAGASYEAFSYQLKCAGRAACIWTTWLELVYLVLSVASVDAMLLALSYSSASGRLRRALSGYALLHIALYTAAVLLGALLPLKFLISFELLILACAPTILLFLGLNGWRYARRKLPLDRVLLGAWAWLVLTIAAYFLYYLSGLTQILWARGAWFSENDVLHLGLIGWMIYLALVLAPRLADARDTAEA
jgi:hypothetical protein